MDAIERRALYHLLRVNWLHEKSLEAEPWQVEDYRSLTLNTLFERLKSLDISLDRLSFIAFSDECDSPEDLTDHLTADRSLPPAEEDRIYLLIFDLWRRLMSEKPSVSILCNELDYQMTLYDNQELENPFDLQDAIAHFIQILEENVDEGMAPEQAFSLISHYCANDIETFLYDFIAEQLDEDNESYALELLDDFDPYLGNNKWFKLLRMRLNGKTQPKVALKIAQQLIEEHVSEHDLDFNLEFLSFIIEVGDDSQFRYIAQQTMPLLKTEEELRDLLTIAIDYAARFDQEQNETALKKMLNGRIHCSLEKTIDAKDRDLVKLASLLQF